MKYTRKNKPLPLLPAHKRKYFAFYALIISLGITVLGTAVFFIAFSLKRVLTESGISFRYVQTIGMLVAFTGIAIYIYCAHLLGIPLQKTTFYKIKTIVKNEVFDPPIKGDYTKLLLRVTKDLTDQEWKIFRNITPSSHDTTIIPHVILHRTCAFTVYTCQTSPTSHHFKDPAHWLTAATHTLSRHLGIPVLPLIVFIQGDKHYKNSSILHCSPQHLPDTLWHNVKQKEHNIPLITKKIMANMT